MRSMRGGLFPVVEGPSMRSMRSMRWPCLTVQAEARKSGGRATHCGAARRPEHRTHRVTE
jgi:hypothetical protein